MKPTYEQLESEVKSLRAENEKLKELLKKALERIDELEKRLGRNSKNSSKPPSLDQKSNTFGKECKRKISHEGKSRVPYPPERINHYVHCTREQCPHCHSTKLQLLQNKVPFVWQQVELPEMQGIVTQFSCAKYCCKECSHRCIGELPKGVPFSAFGPRLMALIACLTGRFHMAKREAILLISNLYGIELSEGSVINIEENIANALEEIYERIHCFVIQGFLPRHFDETSWRDSGKRHFAWIGTTVSAAYYRIDSSRSQEALRKLIGDFTSLPAVTDRYNAYNALDGPHQYCLAHLIRDFHAFAERKGEDGAIGSKIEKELRKACKIHALLKAEEISKKQYKLRLSHSWRRLDELFIDAIAWGSNELSDLCDRLSEELDHLFAFASIEGMEPTNNIAERDLRKLVLWRKKSYGTRSDRGKRFVERITSVIETLKKNGQNVLDFLEKAVQSFYQKRTLPYISESLGF